jgi:hypothetical protein
MENLNKIFLDCGTNLGQGLLQFIDKNIIDTYELIKEITNWNIKIFNWI